MFINCYSDLFSLKLRFSFSLSLPSISLSSYNDRPCLPTNVTIATFSKCHWPAWSNFYFREKQSTTRHKTLRPWISESCELPRWETCTFGKVFVANRSVFFGGVCGSVERLFQMKSRGSIFKWFPRSLGLGGPVWDRLGSFFFPSLPRSWGSLSL